MNSAVGKSRWSAVALLALAGCSPATKLSPPGSESRSASVRVTGAQGYQETIDTLRGKVVLVDFWATWCAPCVEQFAHTVKLNRQYRSQGLAVVSVSLNVPAEVEQVQDFLSRQDADFDNLLSEYESAVQAINEFDLPGPIPYYRLYDRSGMLVREFAVDPRAERQFTHADIEAAIEALL